MSQSHATQHPGGAEGHGGDDGAAAAEHGGGHGAQKGHGRHRHEEHKHHGPPPWLISFGDMMTLFLCFFIILVTMAPTQEAGLMARGLGSFTAYLGTAGLDSPLMGSKYLAAVNSYRLRFGLDPLSEEELLDGRVEARDADEIEALLRASLRPFTSFDQPALVAFEADSAALTETGRRFLDAIAESLRPRYGQVLVLEGHGDDAGARFAKIPAWLGVARAQTVRRYLVEQHEFPQGGVEARAWIGARAARPPTPCVDARLIEPVPEERVPAKGS